MGNKAIKPPKGDVTAAYNNGADWEFGDGPIEEHGLDDDDLYCLFDGPYYQGTYDLAELIIYFDLNRDGDFVYHWVSRLETDNNNKPTTQGE